VYVAYHPDGQRLVTWSESGIRTYDLDTGRVLHHEPGYGFSESRRSPLAKRTEPIASASATSAPTGALATRPQAVDLRSNRRWCETMNEPSVSREV